MKYRALVAMLLATAALPSWAQMTPGTGTFAVRPGVPTTDLSPPTPWPDGTAMLQNPSGFTSLTPSGGEDSGKINLALATSAKGVFISGGAFLVCTAQIVIPRNKILIGPGIGMYFSGAGAVPYPWPGTTLYCPNNGIFTKSIAFVQMHDNTTMEGFSITGGRQTSGHTNCIDADNAQGITVRKMVLSDCWHSLSRNSDGNKSGDQGTAAKGAQISLNTFWFDEDCMICATVLNGGQGISNERIWENEFEVPFNLGVSYTSATEIQMTANRTEDGGGGILFSNVSGFIISGDIYNRIGGMEIDSSNNGVIAHLRGSGVEPGNIHYFMQMYGHSDNLRIGPTNCSYYYIACFTVSNPLTNSQVYESTELSGLSPLFDSSGTRDNIFPSFIAKSNPYRATPIVAGAFAAPQLNQSYNQTLNFDHTISNISLPNSVGGKDNRRGTIKFVQSPAGNDTVNYGTGYASTPTLSTAAYAIDYVPFTLVGNAVAFGAAKVTSVPPPNELLGGSQVVAANWPTTAAVLNTTGIPSPVDNTTGTRMTEDATTSQHFIKQSTTLTTADTTYCAWVKNEAGTRNVVLELNNPGNWTAIVNFNPVTGAVNASSINSGGFIQGFTAGTGNGFTRLCMDASFNFGVQPIEEYVYMTNDASATPANYAGDNGTSKIDVWGITARSGDVP